MAITVFGMGSNQDIGHTLFTPIVAGTTTAGTGTYAENVGRIKRSGEVIQLRISLSVTTHTGTGNLKITGLPSAFYPKNATYVSVWSSGLTYTAGKTLFCAINTDGSITFQQCDGSAAWASVAIDTAFEMFISTSYMAAK